MALSIDEVREDIIKITGVTDFDRDPVVIKAAPDKTGRAFQGEGNQLRMKYFVLKISISSNQEK